MADDSENVRNRVKTPTPARTAAPMSAAPKTGKQVSRKNPTIS